MTLNLEELGSQEESTVSPTWGKFFNSMLEQSSQFMSRPVQEHRIIWVNLESYC